MRQILVVGLSITGLSVLRFYQKEHMLSCVYAYDDALNDERKKALLMEFPSLRFWDNTRTEDDLNCIDEVVKSPGVPFSHPLIQQAQRCDLPVICDIELFARQVPENQKVIAITGTNGKSTVTHLTGQCLKNAGFLTEVAGNIGEPVLDRLGENVDVWVLELSSFQIETLSSLAPISATCLNLSEDHLDRYASFNDYCDVKKQIYAKSQYAIFNADDNRTKPNVFSGKRQLSFSLEKNNVDAFYANGTLILTHLNGEQFQLTSHLLALDGLQNVANYLAVFLLLAPFNLDNRVIEMTFTKALGLPHRCELVRKINNVTFINDSKGTNVGATLSAISGFYKPNEAMVVILGGQAKGADLSTLANVCQDKISKAILIGEDADKFAAVLEGACEYLIAKDLSDAVMLAYEFAKPRGCVLFSPAAASFDMFKNFSHRGECFRALVKGLT